MAKIYNPRTHVAVNCKMFFSRSCSALIRLTIVCLLSLIRMNVIAVEPWETACSTGLFMTSLEHNVTFLDDIRVNNTPVLCFWSLQAPIDKIIEVRFQRFNIGFTDICNNMDYVGIYDNHTLYGGRNYCGRTKPRDFVSSSNLVEILYQANVPGRDNYFEISWKILDKCPGFACWEGTCILMSQHCDGVKDCKDDSDEIQCEQVHDNQGGTILEKSAECGKTFVAPVFTWNHRIVGGNEAKPGSWPWQAALVRTSTSLPFCGGSIISPRAILTAGHCLDRFSSSPSSVKVYVGRYVAAGNAGEALMNVVNITIHPKYNPVTLDNDIAILKLEKSIVYNSTIRPICYNDFGVVTEGTTCVATGFGQLQSNSNLYPTMLNQVRLPVISNADCNIAYAGSPSITEQHICAGSNKGGVDTCQGDSGGPLVCLIGESTWHQVGITSFGKGCGSPYYPGVYTSVAYYAHWIDSVINPTVIETVTPPGKSDASGNRPETTLFNAVDTTLPRRPLETTLTSRPINTILTTRSLDTTLTTRSLDTTLISRHPLDTTLTNLPLDTTLTTRSLDTTLTSRFLDTTLTNRLLDTTLTTRPLDTTLTSRPLDTTLTSRPLDTPITSRSGYTQHASGPGSIGPTYTGSTFMNTTISTVRNASDAERSTTITTVLKMSTGLIGQSDTTSAANILLRCKDFHLLVFSAIILLLLSSF